MKKAAAVAAVLAGTLALGCNEDYGYIGETPDGAKQYVVVDYDGEVDDRVIKHVCARTGASVAGTNRPEYDEKGRKEGQPVIVTCMEMR